MCLTTRRSRANMDALWEALEEGTLDSVASDHSPSPPALKHLDTGDFMQAWGGISGAPNRCCCPHACCAPCAVRARARL